MFQTTDCYRFARALPRDSDPDDGLDSDGGKVINKVILIGKVGGAEVRARSVDMTSIVLFGRPKHSKNTPLTVHSGSYIALHRPRWAPPPRDPCYRGTGHPKLGEVAMFPEDQPSASAYEVEDPRDALVRADAALHEEALLVESELLGHEDGDPCWPTGWE